MAALKVSDPASYKALNGKLRERRQSPRTGPGVKKLTAEGYRIRQGDWRALYLVSDEQRTVLVERIERRAEGTY